MMSRTQVARLALEATLSTLLRRRALNCLWELTYRCNAKCAICNYWKNPTDLSTELPLPAIKHGLQKVHDYGCRFVNFTGGEPTLRRDLEEIIGAASRLGMWTSMVTNGSRLARSQITSLKEAGLDNLMISLDSADAAVHDSHRGIPGLHERVLQCLEWIGKDFLTGHRTGGFMCVLASHNLNQIADLSNLADKLGVYFVVQPYHTNKTGDPRLKPASTEDPAHDALEIRRAGNSLLSSPGFLEGIQRFNQGQRPPACQAGRKYFAVDPMGFLKPCVDGPRVGHILRDEISVVGSSEALEAVKKCQGCWYCFRGEADSTLSPSGYAEKLVMAGSVVLRNTLRSLRRGFEREQRRAPAVS